jgi:hypothetical protein
MPKRIEARLLEPFYDEGRVYVPYLAKGGRVLLARGDFDESGPTETVEEVMRTARRWQDRLKNLDQLEKPRKDKNNPPRPLSRKAPTES